MQPDMVASAIHALQLLLEPARLAILVVDDSGIEFPDKVIFVKPFDVVQVGLCGLDAFVNSNVQGCGRALVLIHIFSSSLGE